MNWGRTMKAYLVLGLTLLFVFGFAQSQDKIPPRAENQRKGAEKSEQKADAQKPAPQSQPTPINVIVSGNLQFKASDDQPNRKEDSFKWSEWALVVVTALLVPVTAKLVSFTKKLWNATVTLSEDAKKTSERQAREMQASLVIAGKSAEAAEAAAKALPTLERAYVFAFVFSDGIQYHPNKSKLIIRFENHGRTAAIVKIIRAEVSMLV